MFLALVVQLEEDDRSFMLNLYKSYYALARKVAFNISHDNNDTEDLINEAFIKLIGKISLLRDLDSCKITSYVVYTVRNVAMNFMKHKAVENKHIIYHDALNLETIPVGFGDDNDSSNDNVNDKKLIRQEEIDTLSEELSKLPETQKDVLYFKYILAMSDKEIAEALDIQPQSVRQYLTRARRNARNLLGKELNPYAK